MTTAEIRRVRSNATDDADHDVLAVEEPLEIRIGSHVNGKFEHKAISITMRTPGDDAELAAGFLFTEGIIRHAGQIKQIRHCGPGRSPTGRERVSMRGVVGVEEDTLPTGRVSANTIRVDLSDGVDVDLKSLDRHFYTTSSCGVCGKSSIEALHTGVVKLSNTNEPRIDPELIHRLPNILRETQQVFDKTGGLHASALFDLSGRIETVREDVGRHNALDKVIGAKFLAGETPLSDNILLVSGRASFELVQKALMAGIPILAAVGAPSSLAVELAAEFGMTLVGFVRDGRFNIYVGGERVRIGNGSDRVLASACHGS